MKKALVYFLVFIQTISYAQRKTRADRYFEKGDYMNAAMHYEKQLDRSKHTKKAVQNIADSYYNTFQFRRAKYYLKKLIGGRFIGKDKTYDNLYNFKMYQVLSALGNHEVAVRYFKKYKLGLGKKLDTKEAIETIEDCKLKTRDYYVKRLRYNTKDAMFGAVKHKDSIYFVSDKVTSFLGNTYGWTHRPYLNIYKAALRKGSEINPLTIQPLPKIINSKLHEGNFCFNADGTILYFSRSNITKNKKFFDKKKVNNIQLFKSEKVNGKWTTPKKLPFCRDAFSYEHPSLSDDETTLYFSSNVVGEGGFGSYDIYKVAIENNHGQYGDIINLGAVINTPNREQFPFISKKGNLFFSSNGHLGLGMLDIFVSEHVKGKFTDPINLGAPLNSKYDDFNINYYDDTHGYFSSNRKFVNDDIYKFRQIGEIFKREYLVVFEVRDTDTKEYVKNVEIILRNKKQDTIYNNTLDSIANFTMNLLPNTYELQATSNLYMPNSLTIKTIEKKNQKYVLYLTKKLLTKPTNPILVESEGINGSRKRNESIITGVDANNDKGTRPVVTKNEFERKKDLFNDKEGPEIIIKNNELYFKMPPIYFEFNKWAITKESKKELDKLAAKLERHPSIYIKISAHTDSRGTDKYNKFLSQKRAESTRNYLALIGYVNARRMQFEGFGESQPIYDCGSNCTEEQHHDNRRSEFKIIKF